MICFWLGFKWLVVMICFWLGFKWLVLMIFCEMLCMLGAVRFGVQGLEDGQGLL